MRLTGLTLCVVFSALLAVSAAADSFVDRLNAAFASVPNDRRSDLIVLPALAAMDEPPAVLLQRAERAALMIPASPLWSAAAEWSTAEPQQAVLEAIGRVTQETNPRRAMVFALPYGIAGVPTDLIRAGVHAELGDPPTIAGAQLGYLDRCRWLALLVSIETTRLQEAGEPVKAIQLNRDLAAFARQIADRALGQEVFWAYDTMAEAMRRIRDVAYVDSKGAEQLTGEQLTEIVAWLDLERGLFRADRLLVPTGDRLAAEQLTARVFDGSGQPREGVFATTMAEMASTGRPLRLFAEAGRWSDLASGHAPADATRRAIEGVYADWNRRWNADPFDRLQRAIPAYMLLDETEYALVREAVPNLTRLFDLRRALRTELNGTRVSLALRALTASTGGVASSLAIVRPRYIDNLGDDPFNPNRAAGNIPELRYFVPERDTVGGRPHQMNIAPTYGANFSVRLTQDDFVLYSLGGNENDDRAINVTDQGGSRIGDYLIWPPIVSLTRDYLALSDITE